MSGDRGEHSLRFGHGQLQHRHAQHGDEQVADICSSADEARSEGARFAGPDFIHERDAERPLAAHSERRDEAQRRDVPRFGREAARAGEDCIGEDAHRHRAHTANFVTEPAEEHAAAGRADEEDGDDHAEPLCRIRCLGGTEQIGERSLADEREQPHLEPVEKPPEEGSDQGHDLSALRDGEGGDWDRGHSSKGGGSPGAGLSLPKPRAAILLRKKARIFRR